jgi:FKBP-type peptidyl-prolyl cis-trans isomerase (trigger factor)
MITKLDAILSLYPTAQVSVDDYQVIWYEPSVAPVTEQQIEAELARLQTEYNTKQYARNRAAEYPSIGDQLDALFHAGVFPEAMAAEIQAIKDKYPKS